MKTGRGNKKWCSEDVIRTLKNEKYCGNAILQKTFKKDLLAKREVNNGEARKFFVENGHEAIITPEQFDMAHQELEERNKEERQHSSKSIFTSKIVCGCCGGLYGSKVWHSTDKYRTVIWQCKNKFTNDVKCKTPHLKEEEIKEIYLKALNQLITDKEPALEIMKGILAKVSDTAKLKAEVEKAEAALDDTIILFQDYISKNAITESDLAGGKYVELETKYNSAMEKVENLRSELTTRMRRAAAIERFIEKVSSYTEVFQEFTEESWLGLADKIIVKDKGTYIVRFKNGVEILVEA